MYVQTVVLGTVFKQRKMAEKDFVKTVDANKYITVIKFWNQ